ncbi:hypothetical protein CIL03_05770 [Virgibacillus indicus]|uniref:Transcriptional regulator n=1 Tax=Virgibacillus indicus TaxID=2024554 RepID=A0A265ND52_9BACI|nr:hypothetical protein [Virgibacillus indicus]OZU89226.1 hypothetical protein CIL03_05770 [Virgibacillus indicus]
MKVKIAVFASESVMKCFIKNSSQDNKIEIVPFLYKKAEEVNELIEKAIMCDLYLFAEPLSFFYAQEKIKKKKLPAVQVPFDEYMVLTSFYRLIYNHKQQLNRLSIDVYNRIHVEEVLRELDKKEQEIYTYSYCEEESIDPEEIVSFHQHLWDEGKIDYVLTSAEEIEYRLQEYGIPVSKMAIPMKNVHSAVEKAELMARVNQNSSALIIVGSIRIKNLIDIKLEKGELAAQKLLVNLYNILLNFSQETDASVLAGNNNEFFLFGTKKVLDHITNHYRDFPLLREMERTVHTPVEIGFGLGLTARQAEDHARLALEACSNSEHSSCFIVNDRQETIGPLGIKKQFDSSRLYQSLIHKARLNNELSYNFIDFITIRNNEPFSSNDIALYYRVTKRSAERTINKLLSGEVIKVVGEEKPYVKGRPRKLFTLNQ